MDSSDLKLTTFSNVLNLNKNNCIKNRIYQRIVIQFLITKSNSLRSMGICSTNLRSVQTKSYPKYSYHDNKTRFDTVVNSSTGDFVTVLTTTVNSVDTSHVPWTIIWRVDVTQCKTLALCFDPEYNFICWENTANKVHKVNSIGNLVPTMKLVLLQQMQILLENPIPERMIVRNPISERMTAEQRKTINCCIFGKFT